MRTSPLNGKSFSDRSHGIITFATKYLQGQLRYGWARQSQTGAWTRQFCPFHSRQAGLKVIAQDGKPLPSEHLISPVNLRVEVRGEEVNGTFRLLAMTIWDILPAQS